ILTSAEGADTTVTEVAKRLGLDKSSASRRIRQALESGHLINLEERKGKPFRLRLGRPLPEDGSVLPETEELGCCGGVDDLRGIDPPPSPEDLAFGEAALL